MKGKSVTLWLFVFGLSLAAAGNSDEDTDDADRGPDLIIGAGDLHDIHRSWSPGMERAPERRAADYEYYEDAEGSLKLHPAAPWREARLVCLGEGAELASPETPGLRAAMSTVLLSSPESPEQVYTGINDLYSKGLFSSLRGTPLTDMPLPWVAGAPSNSSHNTCLALRRDGLMRDTTCDDAALPYICYKKQAAGPETECGTSPEYKFNKDAESCYKIHKSGAAWKEAYASCRREGAHLVVLGGAAEARVVRGLAREAAIDHIHVGATRWENGDWMTIHGETLQQAGFSKWNGKESSAPDSCAGLVAADAVLAQHACSLELPFICEKKPLPYEHSHHYF